MCGIIASAASTTTSFPANFTLLSTLDNSVLTTDGWGIYDSTLETILTCKFLLFPPLPTTYLLHTPIDNAPN